MTRVEIDSGSSRPHRAAAGPRPVNTESRHSNTEGDWQWLLRAGTGV